MKTLKNIQSELRPIYYRYTCEYCNQDVVMTSKELTKEDEQLVFKCCNCGYVNKVEYKDYWNHHCDERGENKIVFELDQDTTDSIREFIKEHDHRSEFGNKIGLTALGQQFTYHITPGGLGPTVVIECNHCHKKKDVTGVEKW